VISSYPVLRLLVMLSAETVEKGIKRFTSNFLDPTNLFFTTMPSGSQKKLSSPVFLLYK